jgi:hypothetical protein
MLVATLEREALSSRIRRTLSLLGHSSDAAEQARGRSLLPAWIRSQPVTNHRQISNSWGGDECQSHGRVDETEGRGQGIRVDGARIDGVGSLGRLTEAAVITEWATAAAGSLKGAPKQRS